MKLSAILATAAALTAFALAPDVAQSYTNPITIKGYKMFDAKTGAYFAAKGIDYYPRPNTGKLDANNIDFFTDDYYDIWSKDIEYLAGAGANAVRLYAVDPTKSHDMFMCALRSYGMYALVDLGASCEGCAISNDKYPACYPPSLKARGEHIILAFAKYDNVLGFSAGNEVNHVVTDASINAPCQKKFIRDMRKFLDGCSKTIRSVPVGVVLADHQREENARYYNCRTDPADKFENAEWYGLNAYQHCNAKATKMNEAGGFTKMATDFVDFKMSIPVMLTEFGCLNKEFPTVDGYEAQRTWLQAGWLFSPEMRAVFSGGFTFEFSTENANSKADSPYPFTKYGPQNYGLGYYQPATCDHSTTPCVFTPMPNYKSLAAQYNATTTAGEPTMTAFTPDSSRTATPACPTGFSKLSESTWAVDTLSSIACPGAALSFTCPNQVTSGTWVGTTQVSTTTTPATATPTTPTTTSTTPSGATPTPSTTPKTGSNASSSGFAMSAISACLALAMGVAFA
ncbi:hypothetical protein PybrP1_001770 [[Pythium] brassicae (nom. inval.)]|nr:hypothetical protein PybrP1_001770 [[Pythium] brassicae (nom. inval.)]